MFRGIWSKILMRVIDSLLAEVRWRPLVSNFEGNDVEAGEEVGSTPGRGDRGGISRQKGLA